MPPRIHPTVRKQMQDDYETGMSLDAVASKYSRSKSTVQRIIDEANLMRDRSGLRPKNSAPKTFDELTAAVLKLMPTAQFSYDSTGQLVIHTGLKTVTVEALVPIED